MNQTLLLAVLPLAGVALGAFLQSKRDLSNQKKTLKIKAYTDYLQAAAALSNKDTGKHDEARTLLTDARLRILIYGSSKIVGHIATFDRTGANLHTIEGMRTFLPVMTLMREDNLNDKIKKEDMTRILFGQDTLD